MSGYNPDEMDEGQLQSTGVGGSVSRNHGIAVSRRESGQSDYPGMEERETLRTFSLDHW